MIAPLIDEGPAGHAREDIRDAIRPAEGGRFAEEQIELAETLEKIAAELGAKRRQNRVVAPDRRDRAARADRAVADDSTSRAAREGEQRDHRRNDTPEQWLGIHPAEARPLLFIVS